MMALMASLLLSAPELLLACAGVFLAAQTGWLPAGGMSSPGAEQMTFARRAMDVARHTILPVSVLAAGMLPLLLRQMRASTAEALNAGLFRARASSGVICCRWQPTR
jgi:peptide/nickel transport system permease protein